MKQRPTNLNFLTIHFPITAWVSILHRLSGFYVFLCIPILLWVLQESLASEERLSALKNTFSGPLFTSILWLLAAAFIYHLVAGIRHLLMDVHIGESKAGGRRGAWLVLIISFLLLISAGYFYG